MTGLITLTGTQAAFAPVDTDALVAAVGYCVEDLDNFNSETGTPSIICTGGCLGETPDGSCPKFAASNDVTGNPYGVIGDWDVSQVTDMSSMFYIATQFNGDISKWNTGAVTHMGSMFANSDFNGDISKWNTGAVTDMGYMFVSAGAFNSDLSKWNTGAVTDMSIMFQGASAFNSDISKWDTSAVTSMRQMFMHATVFNQDLSKWNTGVVTDMYSMFYRSGFKRTLCGGQWQALSSDSDLTSTGRLGCCLAGNFMSDPLLDPFSVAKSCQQCPLGFDTASPNDETLCTRKPCLFADEFVGCTDDDLHQIKVFYSNRQSC